MSQTADGTRAPRQLRLHARQRRRARAGRASTPPAPARWSRSAPSTDCSPRAARLGRARWGRTDRRDRPGPRRAGARPRPGEPRARARSATSHEALASLELPDVVILDGDHNYFTVAGELELIASAPAERLPLILLHDIGWPLGPPRQLPRPRRDARRASPAARPGGLPGPGRGGHSRAAASITNASPPAKAVRATASSPRSRTSSPASARACGWRTSRRSSASASLWSVDAPWAAALEAMIAPLGPQPGARAGSRRSGSSTWSPSSGTCQTIDDDATPDYVLRQRADRAAADDARVGRLRRSPSGSRRCGRAGARSFARRSSRPGSPTLAADDIDVEYLRARPSRSPKRVTMRAYEQTPERPAHVDRHRRRTSLARLPELRAPRRRSGSVRVQLELRRASPSCARASSRWSWAAPMRSR